MSIICNCEGEFGRSAKIRISLPPVAMPWDWLRQSLSVALYSLRQVRLSIFHSIHVRGLHSLLAVGLHCPQTCSKFGEGPCFDVLDLQLAQWFVDLSAHFVTNCVRFEKIWKPDSIAGLFLKSWHLNV